MEINLNTQLTPTELTQEYGLNYKFKNICNTRYPIDKNFQYISLTETPTTKLKNLGFMGLLSECYSKHLNIAINPHDIWILLISELSKEVNVNSKLYRHLFTSNSDKETIVINNNSLSEMPIDVLSTALSTKILFDSNLLIPSFSTETPIVKETIQSIFIDMASPYYDYCMYCCGIPNIKILGTFDDWIILENNFNEIIKIFNQSHLYDYQNKVLPILKEFKNVFSNNINIDFWKDIFTQKNIGSGGELSISGWITALFIKTHDLPKITNFTDNIGVIRYKQLNLKREFISLNGGFDTQLINGYYQLEYKKYIFEKIPYLK